MQHVFIYGFFPLDGRTGCLVEEVLVFFTGADRVPPLGFDQVSKVVFLHNETAKFCTASTCDLHLRLPICYGEDYDAFKEALIMSLKDNDGFGAV